MLRAVDRLKNCRHYCFAHRSYGRRFAGIVFICVNSYILSILLRNSWSFLIIQNVFMNIKCLQVLLRLYKHRKTQPYELRACLRAAAASCGHCCSCTVLNFDVDSIFIKQTKCLENNLLGDCVNHISFFILKVN